MACCGGPINGFHYYKLKLIAESWAHSNTTNELLIIFIKKALTAVGAC